MGTKCPCCHAEVESTHKHHIVPKVLGGVDSPTNIVECCESCHGKIHGRDMLNHTKLVIEGLQKAKARGVQLGAYRDGVYVGFKGSKATAKNASEARTALYKSRALEKVLLLDEIDPDRTMSLRALAKKLNELSISTISGKGTWSSNSVRRLKTIK
jgi:hypothetical protein|tara:strand:+ start:1173 stop:1640 length:468 start_codon:yes stop_codon:yes gene_type:complete